MPQLTLEYSSNVQEGADSASLFHTLHATLAKTLPTAVASCKSRAYEAAAYTIGEGREQDAFVHLSVKILPGRPETLRAEVGEALLELLGAHFNTSLESLQLQITVEVSELPASYFKKASQ